MEEESIDVTDGNTAGDTETTDTSASATAEVLATVPEQAAVQLTQTGTAKETATPEPSAPTATATQSTQAETTITESEAGITTIKPDSTSGRAANERITGNRPNKQTT